MLRRRQSKIVLCVSCHRPVALLIEAPEAVTEDQLSAEAKRMEEKIRELNVPTWVVGAEQDVTPHEGRALVLEKRSFTEKIRPMFSTELNPILESLQSNHCQRKEQKDS